MGGHGRMIGSVSVTKELQPPFLRFPAPKSRVEWSGGGYVVHWRVAAITKMLIKI